MAVTPFGSLFCGLGELSPDSADIVLLAVAALVLAESMTLLRKLRFFTIGLCNPPRTPFESP